MSAASEGFTQSIRDAENLLQHFDTLNRTLPPEESEVLKRAGLIMAMTAWETYVEDRVREATEARLGAVNDKAIVQLVLDKLGDELSKFHNPTTERTIQIFLDYVGINPTSAWTWQGWDEDKVKKQLNEYLKLRGDVVHRSRKRAPGATPPHPVKRDDLERAIRFLKNLVDATESALSG